MRDAGQAAYWVIALLLATVGTGAGAQVAPKPLPPPPLPGLKSGAVVRLQPGAYPLLNFQGLRFDPPVTIEAGETRVMGLRFIDSSGIIWRGGDIRAPKGRDDNTPNSWGVDIRRSSGLTIENSQISVADHAMVVTDSNGVIVRDSVFTNLRSDGIDLAGTSNVVIENNRFSDFEPKKPTGSRADGTWKDGDHPDAIQIWTTPANRRVTDITVRGNTIVGDTQGINLFGPKGDGYARIFIENNVLDITYPAAISVFVCDSCRVRGNRISKIAGSPYKATIRFENSTGKACGNAMRDFDEHPAKRRCK